MSQRNKYLDGCFDLLTISNYSDLKHISIISFQNEINCKSLFSVTRYLGCWSMNIIFMEIKLS